MTLRLFCFPYAGGGPAVFRAWQLPSAEVVPVVYPGVLDDSLRRAA